MSAIVDRPVTERALEALRRAGNPFRNYFARNPDDEVCARYHVPELYAEERKQLFSIVDLYRHDSMTQSEVVPILGNKGSGKTHLLYSIKHGHDGSGQILVTPGVYQKDSDFLEYLLFQTVDTLLGGGRQRGQRPLESVGDELSRRILAHALDDLSAAAKARLFPSTGRWKRIFGLGNSRDRAADLSAALASSAPSRHKGSRVRRLIADAGLDPAFACDIACNYVDHTETHNTAGLMRRAIFEGFCKATLLGDESDLANFLTNGFAELPYSVRPTRQDLVLTLFKVLMEIFRGLKLPVVVAFDQLEDLLLARRTDDGHKIAEAFFAGIVQAMHQIDGLCFLVFAERGLWNRFVPSLDGYIQDRLNNPIHIAGYGSVQALRLEAPEPGLVMQVVEARLAPALMDVTNAAGLSPIFPFTEEQLLRIAQNEPTLRDMLQQCRQLFDRVVFDREEVHTPPTATIAPEPKTENRLPPMEDDPNKFGNLTIKSTVVIPSPEDEADIFEAPSEPEIITPPLTHAGMLELWEQEQRIARRKLEPEGALQGATRELQAGLGTFLQMCHEHGVKVGPWRLHHVVGEWSFGEHPTYGAITIAHWACRGAQPWKVGIGLFLARSGGKPKDLEVKLSALDVQPAMLDHLILLRPEDDLGLSGKSKQLWQDAERRGHHARIEPISLDGFAQIASFPRWLSALGDASPAGQPVSNLADLIQEQCEKLLEQVCMPIQG
ncbi:MAG: hypothetical protein ACJ8C4_19110 [Gemmataceae bacterium]